MEEILQGEIFEIKGLKKGQNLNESVAKYAFIVKKSAKNHSIIVKNGDIFEFCVKNCQFLIA